MCQYFGFFFPTHLGFCLKGWILDFDKYFANDGFVCLSVCLFEKSRKKTNILVMAEW